MSEAAASHYRQQNGAASRRGHPLRQERAHPGARQPPHALPRQARSQMRARALASVVQSPLRRHLALPRRGQTSSLAAHSAGYIAAAAATAAANASLFRLFARRNYTCEPHESMFRVDMRADAFLNGVRYALLFGDDAGPQALSLRLSVPESDSDSLALRQCGRAHWQALPHCQ